MNGHQQWSNVSNVVANPPPSIATASRRTRAGEHALGLRIESLPIGFLALKGNKQSPLFLQMIV